jgi:hypothetical protein
MILKRECDTETKSEWISTDITNCPLGIYIFSHIYGTDKRSPMK